MAVKQWTIRMEVKKLTRPDGRRASSADELFTAEELTRTFALASANLVGVPDDDYILNVTRIKESESNDYVAILKVDDQKGLTEATMSHVLNALEDVLSLMKPKFSIMHSETGSGSKPSSGGLRRMSLG